MYKKILFVCLGLLVSALAWANEEKPETPEREIYGDWFTLCAKSIGVCTMNQLQFATREEQRTPVLHVHISKNPDNTLIMQLILPLGVFLPPGVAVKIDQGEEFILPYQACTANGCIAATQLTTARLQTFKKGNEALVGFKTMGTDKTAVIRVSLKGFTKASQVVENSKSLR